MIHGSLRRLPELMHRSEPLSKRRLLQLLASLESSSEIDENVMKKSVPAWMTVSADFSAVGLTPVPSLVTLWWCRRFAADRGDHFVQSPLFQEFHSLFSQTGVGRLGKNEVGHGG